MPLPIGHLEKVRALAICDRVLAVGGVRAGSRSSLSLYDFVGEKPLASIELPAHVLGLVADKAGVIAACSDGALRWFALPGGAAEREVAAHDGAINAVALFGQVLVTAGQDGIVRTFSRADGSALRSFTVSSRPLRSIAVDPAGEAFAAAGDDGTVRVVWPAGGVAGAKAGGEDRQREMSGHDGAVFALAFTPEDGRVVSGGEDGTIRIWFLTGEVEADVRGKDDSGHIGGAHAILFLPAIGAAPAGERFATAGADGKIKIWRLSERRRPRALETRGSEPLFAIALGELRKTGNERARVFGAGDTRIVTAYGFDAEGQPIDTRIDHEHGFTVLANESNAPARAKREAVARTLAALDEPEAFDLIVRMLARDQDPEVRALAAKLLADHNRRGARKALRERLDDSSIVVRRAALAALQSMDAATPVSPLRYALASTYGDVRASAVAALAPLFAASPLVAGLAAPRLADSDMAVRAAALRALVAMYPERSIEPLRVAFERGAADVRIEVLVRGALASLLSDATFAALVGKGLDDDDAGVRRVSFVVSALGRSALVARLSASDAAFVSAVKDVAHRVAGLDRAATGELKPDEIEAARARLYAAAGVSIGAAPTKVLAEPDREPLLAALACHAPDTCLRGARGLALLGDPRALGALLTLSREAQTDVRRGAAFALAGLAAPDGSTPTAPDPRVLRRLAWMMSDPDAPVRDTAFECYGKLERDPILVARTALHSSFEDLRVRGLDLLVTKGKGNALAEELLEAALEDESAKVRAEAFRTLWAWHDDAPFGPLDRAARARFPDLRQRAVASLVTLTKGPNQDRVAAARERIEKAIADRDGAVGKDAYTAAVELAGKKVASTHLAAIASTVPAVRALGAKGATKAPAAEVRSALSKLLEDTDAGVRVAAIEALDALLPDEPGPVAVGLQSSHLDLRVRAAELLAVRRDDRIVNPMQALIADKDFLQRAPNLAIPLRQRASVALASLGSPALLRYFATELIKDDDPIVREQAARGLANASRQGEEGHLLDLLGHAEVAIRSWGAEGLARLGDARALPVLTGTLKHSHPPIRVGSILSFAALGPEGYGGMLQGLEDPSREVQRVVMSVILARDLRAFRRGEPPELLTCALSSQRPEVRFAAARALELRADPDLYLAHLVALYLPELPTQPEELEKWPAEPARARLMVALAHAIASERPEQRYAAAQALRLRDRPLEFFREVARATKLRAASSTWVPETTPRAPTDSAIAAETTASKSPLRLLRRLFANGPDSDDAAPEQAVAAVPDDERIRLALLACGAFVGLLREEIAEDEANRVRRDAIERIVALVGAGHVPASSAAPALARALDDANHLVRRAALGALRKIFASEPEAALTFALASTSGDVVRGALDEIASRGEAARPRLVRALDSNVAEARLYAFELLERLAPKGSVEPLLAALESSHADIRIGVLERLATSRDARVSAALGRALASDHEDLRLRAAELLAERVDDRAVDVAVGALRSENEPVKARALELLVRLGTPAAVRAIAAFLDEVTDAKVPIVEALGRMRGAEPIDVLSARFNDDDATVRSAATAGCERIVGPRSDAKAGRGEPKPKVPDHALAARFLAAAVASRFADVRGAAARRLDDVVDPSADPLLITLFKDRNAEVRALATTAYAKRVEKKNAALEPLDEVLREGARETLLPAAEGLAVRGVTRAFRSLMLYVRAGEAGERERALVALGTLGDKRALAELELVASGGTEDAPADDSMRAAALEGLGRLSTKLEDAEARDKILDRIEGAAAGTVPTMIVAAARALGCMGGERARARLERLFLARNTDNNAKAAAIEALGKLGDPAAEKTLAKALSDGDERIRELAREALEKVFPGQQTRIELLAIESDHDDVSGPAAAYLAREGDAGQLLEKLAKLENDALREQLRYALVRRPTIEPDALAKLLAEGSPAARAAAAWLIGVRCDEASREVLGRAVVAAVRASDERRREHARAGRAQGERAELEVELASLYAARRLRAAGLDEFAQGLLRDIACSPSLRVEAARAIDATAAAGARALRAALIDPDASVRAEAATALAPLAASKQELAATPLDAVLFERRVTPASCESHGVATTAERCVVGPLAIRSGKIGALGALARSDASLENRLDAVAMLSLSSAPEALEVLGALAARESPDAELRKAAYRALRRAQRRVARQSRAASANKQETAT